MLNDLIVTCHGQDQDLFPNVSDAISHVLHHCSQEALGPKSFLRSSLGSMLPVSGLPAWKCYFLHINVLVIMNRRL